ncbi:MAG: OsmC family protein, partial [Bacteroidales bacterium]
IKLIGTLTEEHPKHYTAIHLVYQFTGKDLDPDKLRKAIDLSQDRYCGVSETLRKGVKISYDVEVI